MSEVDIDSVKVFIPQMSVTNPKTPRDEARDRVKPFTYIEWIKHVMFETRDAIDYTLQYNAYLKAWGKEQNKTKTQTLTLISDRYKALLIDITLNYTTPEERRFLDNIDLDNVRHVESALPFYVSKIKQITLYISRQRDIVKQQKVLAATGGAVQGITREISNNILNRVLDPTKFNVASSPSTAEPYFNVRIVELYDLSQKYFQQNNAPIETTTIFKGFDKIVEEVLNECKPVLVLSQNVKLVLNNEPIELNVDSEIQRLAYSEFIDYTKRTRSLNKLYLDEYFSDRLGSDIYELSNGEITLLNAPSKPWRNIYNRSTVSVNTDHELDALKSVDEIGGFFVPKNMGILTFYSYKPELIITNDAVSITKIQDVYKHGNSIISKTQDNPINHFENITWMKADIGNGSLYGDIINVRSMAKYNGYTSIDEINSRPQQGISRSTDALGFFSGDKNKTWSNEDVFPVKKQFTFDIDARQDTLLVGHRSMFRWRSDIYGNEYALYKQIQPERGPFDYALDDDIPFNTDPKCEVIDGGSTLLKHKEIDGEELETTIFEGGRTGGFDPKVEQYLVPIPFPDLRRMVDIDESGEPVFEEFNSTYYGLDPNADRDNMGVMDHTEISFHGFSPDVQYDRQAYGSLFTDDRCGRILPDVKICSIIDNYAFAVYSEEKDAQGNHISTNRPADDISVEDAYDFYVYPEHDDWDPDYGLSNFGFSGDEIELQDDGDIDGWFFNTEICDSLKGDFEHVEINETFYDQSLDIGETTYEDEPEKTLNRHATLYEQQAEVLGTGYFRSYNSQKIADFKETLKEVIGSFEYMEGDDFQAFKRDIDDGKILDIDILYDVIVIETRDYLFIEKLAFDAENIVMDRTGKNHIFIKTTGNNKNTERSLGWFFDERRNQLIFGRTVEAPMNEMNPELGSSYVYPLVYTADLNDLSYTQAHPNKHYKDQVKESFKLPLDLQNYTVELIDRPVISFNDSNNVYNISYSAKISNNNNVKYSIFSGDYRFGQFNLKLKDVYIFHAKEIERYNPPGEEWDDRVDEKEIKLYPDDTMRPIFPQRMHTTKTESIQEMLGHPLSGYKFTLKIDTKTIPVSYNLDDFKINQIIFDPGDGSEKYINYRVMDDGLQPLTFDLTELPDPSDFGDPRRLGFEHEYLFDKSEPHTYVATVSAIYSNFTTATYKINIETIPYDTDSAFDGLKLIGSKLFTDPEGKDRQLLILETQNPRWVTNVVVDRNNRVQAPIEGFVDGTRYIGEYHTTPEGVLMTGAAPSPQSKRITLSPTTQFAEPYLKTDAYGFASPNQSDNHIVGYVDGEPYAGPWHSMSNGMMMTGANHTPDSKVISLTVEDSLNTTTNPTYTETNHNTTSTHGNTSNTGSNQSTNSNNNNSTYSTGY